MTIPSTYDVAKLSDYVYFQEGPGIRNSQNTTEGIKFLNIRCFVNGRLDTASMKNVAESEALGRYKHFLLDVGDYVVSSSGTLGRIAEVYPEDLPVMLNTSTIRFRPIDNLLLDRLYLRYFLESEVFQQQVKSLATGSVQLNYGPSHLAFVEMPLPPIEIQKVIGKILDSITRKIELNAQASKTMEDIAQSVFKSWFIDFDPVKAKLASERPAGMDAATAALFPDSMEESELGVIPKTWEIKTLGEVVDISWGDTKTTKASYVSNGFKAYSAKGQDGFLTKFDYSEMGIVLSAIGANCGKTWLATGKWSCIKNTMRIIGTPSYPEAIPYIYFLTNRLDFWERRGTAQPFIGQEDSRSLRILFPGRYLMGRFSEITVPIFDKINKLSEENGVLIELRDSLLPRLISGELQIPEEMLAS